MATFIDPNTGLEREVGSKEPEIETINLFNPETGGTITTTLGQEANFLAGGFLRDTPKDILARAGAATSAQLDVGIEDIRTREEGRLGELRGILGGEFGRAIEERRERGVAEIGGTKAQLGISRGLGVSSSRQGFIQAQQTQIDKDIRALETAKATALTNADFASADREDVRIQQLKNNQFRLQQQSFENTLALLGETRAQKKFEASQLPTAQKPVTLSPGASLFTPTGELLATAPLKPTTNKPVTQLIDNDTGGKDLWQWNPTAIDETTGEQGVWELKVEAPAGTSILDFSEISPLDQLKARNLSVEIFGKRAGTKQENIDLISGLVQTGLTIDDIQDKLRFSSQSEAFTGVFRDAAESIATTFSDGKATRFFDALDRHLEAGEMGKARDLIEKNAISGVGTAEAQGIRGKKRTVEFLQEIARDLQRFEDEGGGTGFFKGKIEKLAGKVGQVKDPELRKIATKINIAIQSYRRALSGVAFSVPESKEYKEMFPNIDKVGDFNTANIEALTETFEGDLSFFFGSQMGDDAFQQIFNDKDVTDAITGQDNRLSFPDVPPLNQNFDSLDALIEARPDFISTIEAAEEQLRSILGREPDDEEILQILSDFSQPLDTGEKGQIITTDIGNKSVQIDSSIKLALESADEQFFKATGEHIQISESFRTRERQEELFKKLSLTGGRVAPPGSSFHEKGLAIDVINWREAEPFLRKLGFKNDLADDKGHFSIGEFV